LVSVQERRKRNKREQKKNLEGGRNQKLKHEEGGWYNMSGKGDFILLLLPAEVCSLSSPEYSPYVRHKKTEI